MKYLVFIFNEVEAIIIKLDKVDIIPQYLYKYQTFS